MPRHASSAFPGTVSSRRETLCASRISTESARAVDVRQRIGGAGASETTGSLGQPLPNTGRLAVCCGLLPRAGWAYNKRRVERGYPRLTNAPRSDLPRLRIYRERETHARSWHSTELDADRTLKRCRIVLDRVSRSDLKSGGCNAMIWLARD